jgi:phosphoribosylformimino-5-aminoimidazole carboxamide ribonucleotide (ProFAR) isomerase
VFEVIPAIDVANGRLAVYSAAGPQPVRSFEGDPLAAARSYVEAGARWIHVVDMDLAFTGVAANMAVIEEVASLDTRVQASGGIREARTVDRLFAAGASRVVLGSGVLGQEAVVGSLISTHGDRLALGIEVEDGEIRSRGAEPVERELVETLGWLTAAGASRFVVTSVSRVGGLAGPDVALIKRVVRSGRPVVAAGGVRTVEDLEALRRAGAVGAVIGRAAMEGDLDLGAAIARFAP